MWNWTLLGLALLGGLGVAGLASICSPGESKPAPVRIRAEDLCNGKCDIIGRLGKAYGEISTVRSVWVANEDYAGKGIKHFLRITHVDGLALRADQQIVIEDHYVTMLKAKMEGRAHPPVAGEVVEGRVFESGGYIRYPAEVRKILGELPVQDVYGFRFYSFVYFVD
jgi:hypothetical protein